MKFPCTAVPEDFLEVEFVDGNVEVSVHSYGEHLRHQNYIILSNESALKLAHFILNKGT
jgi:hypothetical protein